MNPKPPEFKSVGQTGQETEYFYTLLHLDQILHAFATHFPKFNLCFLDSA